MMTSAEYTAYRKACGLTVDDAMAVHGVKNRRTIERWESGYSCVSARAETAIKELYGFLMSRVEQTVSFVKEKLLENSKIGQVVLIEYPQETADMLIGWQYPLNAHKILNFYVYIELEKLKINANIVRMDRKAYMNWLSGRPDTQQLRAEWGASQKKTHWD